MADDEEVPNVLTPRAFAVLLILRELAKVREQIRDHDREYPPGPDLFHSQIRVWLNRLAEILREAADRLEEPDDGAP